MTPRDLLSQMEDALDVASRECHDGRLYDVYDTDKHDVSNERVGKIGIALAKAQYLFMDLCNRLPASED